MVKMRRFQWWYKEFLRPSSVLLMNGTNRTDSETFTVWEISTVWSNTFWEHAKKDKSISTMTNNSINCLRKLYLKTCMVWTEVSNFLWNSIEAEQVKSTVKHHFKPSLMSFKAFYTVLKNKTSDSHWLLLRIMNHCHT